MSKQRPSEAPAPEDDAAALAQVVSGSSDSLAALYDRHASRMLGLAAHMLGNRRDAEDLLHDVFLEVWRGAGSYDPLRSSVRTWLLVKLRSRALDRLRSLGVARRHGIGPLGQLDPEDQDADFEVLRSVDRSRALAVLAGLPDAQRDVIELMYLDGFSCSEIADRRGVPVGTVKSRLARALAVLREQLPEFQEAD
jgi:RNA polymerase sigma-70 factor (ECF subfamily)